MAAPKKPDYKALRKIVETDVVWGVQGRQQRFLDLIERAEWLEEQRNTKPVVGVKTVVLPGGGKQFRGMDPKGGRKGG